MSDPTAAANPSAPQTERAIQSGGEVGEIYLLHFSGKVSDRHTTQHYMGWARNTGARVAHHRKGTGARLTAVAVEKGLTMEVVRTWPGTRDQERQLKRRKEAPAMCPVCAAAKGKAPKKAVLQ
jgi:predicted GIY-YIG superfamily endonuclease